MGILFNFEMASKNYALGAAPSDSPTPAFPVRRDSPKLSAGPFVTPASAPSSLRQIRPTRTKSVKL
jgi:hypothetical protein